jgi:hypothetical protein
MGGRVCGAGNARWRQEAVTWSFWEGAHAVLGGDGLAGRFHERRVDLDDRIAVLADQLGAEGRAAGFGAVVVVLVAADVHLPDDVAADEEGRGAVDRRAGHAAVEPSGPSAIRN